MKKNLPPRMGRLPARQDSEENRMRAFNYSLKYLSFRPRSIKEVNDYLTRKNFSGTTIETTIEKLIELKFLNDEEFAKMWIESRQKHRGKSKFLIKIELKKKGLGQNLLESQLAYAKDDLQTARELFERRKNKFKGLTPAEFKNKMGAFLQRRGFSFEIINKVMKGD